MRPVWYNFYINVFQGYKSGELLRMDKKIFISHSSEDHAFASKLCKSFEDNGVYCWIAPRDIPYGNVWSAEISLAIEQSKLMIFLYSENSNHSKQVIREISLAEQSGVSVIAVKISEEPFNLALKYYLSIFHWVSMDRAASDKALQSFAKEIKEIVENGEARMYASEMLMHDSLPFLDVDVNIDKELDEQFDGILSDGEADGGALIKVRKGEENPIRKKMLERVKQRFFNEVFVPKTDAKDDGDGDSTCGEESDSSYYFEVSEKSGKTMAFLVRKEICEEDYTVRFVPEMLEKEPCEDGDEASVCFNIDRVDRGGNPIITVTFLECQSVALINMGFIDAGCVSFSNNPSTMEMTSLSHGGQDEVKKYRANRHSDKVLIDPEICEIVPRKRYFDKKTNTWGYYMDIVPHKKYFAFHLPSSGGVQPAATFDIAYGYYKGYYGLKKNIISAVEWFEKCDSADGYYYLMQIFKNDPLLADEEDARYYEELYNQSK